LPILSKREMLARQMRNAGLLRLLGWFNQRPGLLVLAYHRIGSCLGHPYDDEIISASAEDFRSQVNFLRTHFDVIGLPELLRVATAGFAVRRPTALVTFDDGYRDNHVLALPILRELNIPAVFFISTGYIGGIRMTWWDHVAFCVKQTRHERIELAYPRPQVYDFGQISRPDATQRILNEYTAAPEIDDRRFLSELEESTAVHIDMRDGDHALFMSWDQVRDLRDSGMGVGAHSHHHPVLGRLSPEEQAWELSTSRDRLRAELGVSGEAVAYPVGSFTEVTKRVAQEQGFRVGFAYSGGINRPNRTDPFEIRRMAVDYYVSMPMFQARSLVYSVTGYQL
jgi:peptidoglycan/xylan/chitin deacetylase (PgdA/CDA1 family)